MFPRCLASHNMTILLFPGYLTVRYLIILLPNYKCTAQFQLHIFIQKWRLSCSGRPFSATNTFYLNARKKSFIVTVLGWHLAVVPISVFPAVEHSAEYDSDCCWYYIRLVYLTTTTLGQIIHSFCKLKNRAKCSDVSFLLRKCVGCLRPWFVARPSTATTTYSSTVVHCVHTVAVRI